MTQPITTDHLQQPLLVICTAVTDGQSTVSDCQSINQSINPDKIFRVAWVARPPQGLWPGKEGRGDRPGAIITAGRRINTGQLRDSPAAEMELTFRRELTIAAANCVQVPRHTASIHTRTPTHRRDRTFALPRRSAPSRKPPSRTSVLITVRG